MAFAWRDDLTTELDEIDGDHRQILAELYALLPPFDGSEANRRRQVVTLQVLERYLIEHIAKEEDYLRSSGYPRLELHVADHARLTAAVAGLRIRLQTEGAPPETLQRQIKELADWVIVHINTFDRDFAHYLHRRSTELPRATA
ncbi:MAG: hemerythrin family protein [Deltaproteobacteria bacterium]|jgi:hemerythrin|nr:hemerythrin family protein [Deltaproteobacteria bacterium]MBW2533615.1 hemerythrin family protein [Deltaproteobacteria bacterium]